jgi:membrane protein DedA with SNARE-associated domain
VPDGAGPIAYRCVPSRVGLDAIFPPIPSEFVLPLAGFGASQGSAGVVATVLWATIGSLAGATVMYVLGMVLGRDRTRALAVRIPLVKVSDVDRAETWFARHGGKAVLAGRMIPLFRRPAAPPQGNPGSGITRLGAGLHRT